MRTIRVTGKGEIKVHPDVTRMPLTEEKASYDLDIEPDDISTSDTVTVIWEIG